MSAQSLFLSLLAYGSNPSRDPANTVIWIIVAIVVAFIAVIVFLRFVPVGLWITSLARAYTSALALWSACGFAVSSPSVWSSRSLRRARRAWT